MGLCDSIGTPESQRYPVSQVHTVLVYLDPDPGGGFRGTMRAGGIEKPVPFRDLGDFALRLDAVCGALEEQDSGNAFRSGPVSRETSCRAFSGAACATDSPDRTSASGPVFTIAVEYRSHHSLQGKVRGGLTGGRYRAFQSALDLMRILTELTSPPGPGREGAAHGL